MWVPAALALLTLGQRVMATKHLASFVERKCAETTFLLQL